MDERNFPDPDLFGFVAPHLGLLITCGVRPQKAHRQRIRFPSVSLGCSKTFPCCAHWHREFRRFLGLAPPTLEISRNFVEIRCILELRYILGVTVPGHFGSAWSSRAPIGVKMNQQDCISCKRSF